MARLSDKQILRIADKKGEFTVTWQWRNDALRRHCTHLMNRGFLVMTWSRGFDRYEITDEGREFLRGKEADQ